VDDAATANQGKEEDVLWHGNASEENQMVAACAEETPAATHAPGGRR
jgi:hypothetical protein